MDYIFDWKRVERPKLAVKLQEHARDRLRWLTVATQTLDSVAVWLADDQHSHGIMRIAATQRGLGYVHNPRDEQAQILLLNSVRKRIARQEGHFRQGDLP